MAYCIKCGCELFEGAQFCGNCGVVQNQNVHKEERKITYEGEIRKCPNCGEVLKSFEVACPSCGYELRGVKTSESVMAFASRLEYAKSEEDRVVIIRNFPIPNTKEDIFEFMILASTNITLTNQIEVFDAWKVKIEQSYQKAKLAFGSDADFIKFQSIFDQTNRNVEKLSKRRKASKIGNMIANAMPQLLIAVGWLISIYILIPFSGMNVDRAGANGAQLLLMFDLIVGAIFVPMVTRGKSKLPSVVLTAGLLISIAILIPLCSVNLDKAGFNAYQLILIVDIISSVIVFVRLAKKKQ